MPKWKTWADPNAPVPAEPIPPLEELFHGPKAGNTTETLAPKTVNVLEPEPAWPKEEIYGDEPVFEPRPKKVSRQMFEQKSRRPESLDDRVTKLEERLDSLLDRFARYNVKAQHKI